MEEDLLFIIPARKKQECGMKFVNFMYYLVINDALCTHFKRRIF